MRRLICYNLAALLLASMSLKAREDIEPLLVRALRYADTPEKQAQQKEARAELERLGPTALQAMVDRLHFENVMLHVVALEFVQNHVAAENGIPILRAALTSPFEQTRRAAAFMIGFYPRDDASIPLLLAQLEREREQNMAIRTLGIWKVDAARPRLRELLRSPKERTRIVACNALGRLADPRDIAVLVEALGDDALLVRNAAARALIDGFGDRAIPALKKQLRRGDGVRLRQCIRVIGELGDRSSRRVLVRLLRHADPDVRADAEWALTRIAGKAPPPSRSWDGRHF